MGRIGWRLHCESKATFIWFSQPSGEDFRCVMQGSAMGNPLLGVPFFEQEHWRKVLKYKQFRLPSLYRTTCGICLLIDASEPIAPSSRAALQPL